MSEKYVDLKTLNYLFCDIYSLENLWARNRFHEYDVESLNIFINAVKEFSDRELHPCLKEMDETPVYCKDGKVFVHKQVHTAMRQS
jgi:butyryl-CoA dehydrogenase